MRTPDGGAEITPYRDGPLVVRGSFVLRDEDGREIDPGRRTVLLLPGSRAKEIDYILPRMLDAIESLRPELGKRRA